MKCRFCGFVVKDAAAPCCARCSSFVVRGLAAHTTFMEALDAIAAEGVPDALLAYCLAGGNDQALEQAAAIVRGGSPT
jgi:hypothetical protein